MLKTTFSFRKKLIIMKTYTSTHPSMDFALNQTSSKPNLPMTETVVGQLANSCLKQRQPPTNFLSPMWQGRQENQF